MGSIIVHHLILEKGNEDVSLGLSLKTDFVIIRSCKVSNILTRLTTLNQK